MTKNKMLPWYSITVDVDGVTHRGRYDVSDEMVRVRCIFGEKSTQVGGSPAWMIARLMLSELVREARR